MLDRQKPSTFILWQQIPNPLPPPGPFQYVACVPPQVAVAARCLQGAQFGFAVFPHEAVCRDGKGSGLESGSESGSAADRL